jgi:hypothetical protein
MRKIVLGLAIMSCGCSLTGCGSRPDAPPTNVPADTDVTTTPFMDFKERQKQLFYEIDHTLVYQGCQELMRLSRERKLSSSTYYCDDPPTKLSQLPEPIRALQPTDVQVIDVMVTIGFLSEDGRQSLRCTTGEFREPAPADDSAKGLGFRKEPFGMDRLSGRESLDYLNETFDHFEMQLIPGLSYQTFKEEQPRTLAEVKQSNKRMDMLFTDMTKTMNQLVIKKQRLLYRTDHQELLKACQESIKRYNAGGFSTDKINIGGDSHNKQLVQDLKHLPKIILNLEPVYVWFDKYRIMVALIGGFDHAGVIAYANETQVSPDDDEIELISGLRYYDDGLKEADADYRDYLKSLQNEAISYLDWKRKQTNPPVAERNRTPQAR